MDLYYKVTFIKTVNRLNLIKSCDKTMSVRHVTGNDKDFLR